MTEEAKQEQPTRRLARMIAEVMLEVEKVATDKSVDHIRMKYASIDAVFDAIRAPLASRPA